MYWTATILLFLGTIWFIDVLPMHIATLVPLALLTFYELIVMMKTGFSYFSSGQNLYDILCFGTSYTLVIAFNIMNVLEETNEYRVLFS